ncbi:hypothetical protein GX48_05739 [Paracoccidioides brasiliensis]|nr:hypothetical protein GX48_05739 [Paracoccidioides brasiliensis]
MSDLEAKGHTDSKGRAQRAEQMTWIRLCKTQWQVSAVHFTWWDTAVKHIIEEYWTRDQIAEIFCRPRKKDDVSFMKIGRAISSLAQRRPLHLLFENAAVKNCLLLVQFQSSSREASALANDCFTSYSQPKTSIAFWYELCAVFALSRFISTSPRFTHVLT